MSKEKATGNLSDAEKKMIQQLAPVKTDKEIGEKLGRNPQTIANHRKKMGIVKSAGGKVSHEKSQPKRVLNEDAEAMLTKAEVEEAWKIEFINSSRYKKLQETLTYDQLEYFTIMWGKYHAQFEDMTTTEEDTVELMIIAKIRIDENSRQYTECLEVERTLREKMDSTAIEELDLENEADRFLFQMVESNNKIKLELNKDMKELNSQYNRWLESLDASRYQRETKQKIGGDTFMGLVRKMTDRKRRKSAGVFAERLKASTQKKMEDLTQPHEFDNHEISPIIMDGQDYMDRAKAKKEEENEESEIRES